MKTKTNKADKREKALKTTVIYTEPLFDEKIEKAVLFCLAYSKEIQNQIYKLSEEDFYSLETKKIFNLFLDIMAKNYTIDPTIIPTSERNKALVEVLTYNGFVSNWESYYKRLKELSDLRKIQNICYEATIKTQERRAIKSIKNYILNSVNQIVEEENIETSDIDGEFENMINDDSLIAVKTGFPRLDYYCNGFLKSSFNVIASYPRAGKSTFVLNMIDNICRVQKKKVLFVSLEMDYVELHAKLVSMLTGISFNEVVFGETEKKNWQAINNARAKIWEWKLYRIGEEDTTPSDIEIKINETKADIVFIDYLQLMNPNEQGNTLRENITNLSRELKQVARRTKVPIVAVSAISRAYSNRDDKRPRLSDLRETSQIEFDAGLVLMLHRESLFREAGEKEDPKMFEKTAEILIAKNRFGKDNISIDFYFDGETGIFREMQIT